MAIYNLVLFFACFEAMRERCHHEKCLNVGPTSRAGFDLLALTRLMTVLSCAEDANNQRHV
jgi:hypothetical protein